MLILITGAPGHGKSLFAVDQITKYLKENEKLVKEDKEPRRIYTDIDGVSIEGVEIAPDDWRDCPDGSVVFYDECQQKFGPDGKGRSGRADVQEFETHRHRGFDILLITQHPKLLHAHIRRLIGRHYHLFRKYGTKNAVVYQRDGQIDVDKQALLEKQDQFLFSYPEQHFGKYKSATVHTHKAEMPKWIKRSLVGAAVIAVLLAFMIPKAMGFFDSSASVASIKGSSGASGGSMLSGSPVAAAVPFVESVPVACVSSAKKCSCYSESGYLVDLSYSRCRKYSKGDLRFIKTGFSDRDA